MNRLSIQPRPIFSNKERREMADNPAIYVAQMVQHLQDVEDWQKTMRDADAEGWGVVSEFAQIYGDGRRARMPESAELERIRARAARRQRTFERYYLWRKRYKKSLTN